VDIFVDRPDDPDDDDELYYRDRDSFMFRPQGIIAIPATGEIAVIDGDLHGDDTEADPYHCGMPIERICIFSKDGEFQRDFGGVLQDAIRDEVCECIRAIEKCNVVLAGRAANGALPPMPAGYTVELQQRLMPKILTKLPLCFTGDGLFDHVHAIASDTEGNLIVLDTTSRVQVFSAKGVHLCTRHDLLLENARWREPDLPDPELVGSYNYGQARYLRLASAAYQELHITRDDRIKSVAWSSDGTLAIAVGGDVLIWRSPGTLAACLSERLSAPQWAVPVWLLPMDAHVAMACLAVAVALLLGH
jgi:hypothetical protein